MGFIKRLLGICRTPLAEAGSWSYENGQIAIDLDRTPELAPLFGAVRLEAKPLPKRILVFKGADEQFHAVRNRCSHMGRRLDPLPDTRAIQCCSVSMSAYDYSGNVMSGPAKTAVEKLPVIQKENRLYISVASESV